MQSKVRECCHSNVHFTTQFISTLSETQGSVRGILAHAKSQGRTYRHDGWGAGAGAGAGARARAPQPNLLSVMW